jgi:regulator of ribonuclease activity A
LCDASAEVRAIQLPFSGFGRRTAFAGAAQTVRYAGGLAALRDVIHEPGAGRVLVIDGAEAGWRALFGDRMAEIAARQGWEGVIVHGLIRDCSEIDEMEIGVKALGTVPQRAELGKPGERDVVVHFGNVTIQPGQRIVADRDGVVVLPSGLDELDINVDNAVAATARYAAGQS